MEHWKFYMNHNEQELQLTVPTNSLAAISNPQLFACDS